MVRLWHWGYQVIPHYLSTATPTVYSACKKRWQFDLLVDRCALAHREHIMISHQRGPGRCQIWNSTSQYISVTLWFTLYPVSILTLFGFWWFLYLRPTQNQCIWTDLGSQELQPPVVKRRAQGHASKQRLQSLQHFSQRPIGKHDAIWHIWCPNVSKSQLKWVCKITKIRFNMV